MSTVTDLTPVNTDTLGWLGWRRGLLGVEPVPAPQWSEPPPDPAAIDARVRQESGRLTAEHDAAVGNARYFAPVVRWAVVACAFAALSGLFLIVAFAMSGLHLGDFFQTPQESAANPSEPTAALTTAGFIALFGPWFAAAVLSRRRRLTRPTTRFFLLGLGLWFLALVLAFVTFGLSFVLMPLAVGLFALFTRPTVFHTDRGAVGRAEAGTLTMWRNARRVAAAHRDALRGLDGRVREELDRAQREYAQRQQEHQQAVSAHVPFTLVDPPDIRDLIVVGGSPVERGDLVHHLGAASSSTGQRVWAIDLEGRGATDRLVVETGAHGKSLGLVRGDDEAALTDMLDLLGATPGRQSSVLAEVLAYAMAQDAEGRAVSRSRETLDTLRRVERHLRDLPGGVTLRRLHDAMDALLAGPGPVGGGHGHDDFGLAADRGGDMPADALPGETVERIRAGFSQQDRQHFYPVWTDLRIKLASLLPHDSYAAPAGRPMHWSAEKTSGVTVVPHTLGRADRELRTALLVSHHLRLLKADGPKPAALAVVGAGHVPPDLLTELSEVATGHGILLVLMFSELVPTVEDMALGRRNIAVFGGHGEQAAERLAELFGRAWRDRVRSYQSTWSVADAESRALTSGRNWSVATSRQHAKTRSHNSSTSHSTGSDPMGGGSGSRSYSYGSSSGTTVSTGRTETEGESSAESVTTGRTTTGGGAETTNVDYERRVDGAEISALPPFTMLIKRGQDVRFVDVKADLVLPDELTAEIEVAPR
ncbi:hypothetical protein [Mangrovihabitans endophyticus]|uniref:Uncharacterized protein n=1 Tax=Mangrovihabitans endophyticus TaxID=1751298 RepID=A0A8J3C647_9ACTN|nr:hypothetical protein [Mangrovihabitans endophyticus]GGL20126.1 hypothetical protein GCM10012284_63420 [Mangrovihabitans endophyticus]